MPQPSPQQIAPVSGLVAQYITTQPDTGGRRGVRVPLPPPTHRPCRKVPRPSLGVKPIEWSSPTRWKRRGLLPRRFNLAWEVRIPMVNELDWGFVHSPFYFLKLFCSLARDSSPAQAERASITG